MRVGSGLNTLGAVGAQVRVQETAILPLQCTWWSFCSRRISRLLSGRGRMETTSAGSCSPAGTSRTGPGRGPRGPKARGGVSEGGAWDMWEWLGAGPARSTPARAAQAPPRVRRGAAEPGVGAGAWPDFVPTRSEKEPGDRSTLRCRRRARAGGEGGLCVSPRGDGGGRREVGRGGPRPAVPGSLAGRW